MGRVLLMGVCVLLAVAPHAALAQGYQQYNDGLVSVTVKRLVDSDQRTAFNVCAHLMRQENLGPLRIRLNLWATSGGFIRQLSLVLRPDLSAPTCQRIQLPSDVGDFGRWEIARFRFLPEPPLRQAGRSKNAG
jgi:hypothetical protein